MYSSFCENFFLVLTKRGQKLYECGLCFNPDECARVQCNPQVSCIARPMQHASIYHMLSRTLTWMLIAQLA